MKIVMMTNTFTPHRGGVARSVEISVDELRRRGHDVLVVAPEFEHMPEREKNVVRVRAIQHFNGSDFSVRLPILGTLSGSLDSFGPNLIHSHHPFLLGGTAQRVAAKRNIPLVFTHHTMYEHYTHYVPGDSPALQRFAIELSTGYANFCNRVIAPSESIAAILRERGVTSPISVIPTGVDAVAFSKGDGARVRAQRGIDSNSFVVGHVGRLAPEKNLPFLAEAVSDFLLRDRRAVFLVVGSGPSEKEIKEIFERNNLSARLHFTGPTDGRDLIDAYHAMDVFAFASRSETQGLVVAESMAAGVPVVAVDAPGVREVVRDCDNGRLLQTLDATAFADALEWILSRAPEERLRLRQAAQATAQGFSIPCCAEKALGLYQEVVAENPRRRRSDVDEWRAVIRILKTEWELWRNMAHAAGSALDTLDTLDKGEGRT